MSQMAVTLVAQYARVLKGNTGDVPDEIPIACGAQGLQIQAGSEFGAPEHAGGYGMRLKYARVLVRIFTLLRVMERLRKTVRGHFGVAGRCVHEPAQPVVFREDFGISG